jgi:PIN domain nuclease of toxin-antitoxin system
LHVELLGGKNLNTSSLSHLAKLANLIKLAHQKRLTTLPFHHRDPFDRLIIAQALAEELPVVSVDSQFDAYGVKRVW